jgi:hypothetical protein
MKLTSFDELTKRLATATSRRQALGTIVTASVSMFGLASIRTVFGGPVKGNSYCANWCHAVYGETTAAGKCTSDAAKGGGLCFTCGNVAPSSLCCVRDTNGFCEADSVVAGCSCDSSECETCDPDTGTCVSACSSDQLCCGGTCAECCGDSDCSSGETCENGMCVGTCDAIGASCPTVGPDTQCCSGQCGPFAAPGLTSGCCSPSGESCTFPRPDLCCSGCCMSSAAGPICC